MAQFYSPENRKVIGNGNKGNKNVKKTNDLK